LEVIRIGGIKDGVIDQLLIQLTSDVFAPSGGCSIVLLSDFFCSIIPQAMSFLYEPSFGKGKLRLNRPINQNFVVGG
jgi:hypothetical protein